MGQRGTPEAWDEYGFQPGGEAMFTAGGRKSGWFGVSNLLLMAEAFRKIGGASLRELGQSRFGDGWVTVSPEVEVKPGDRLLTVCGSCYGLGFVAREPIHKEALMHPELEMF